MLIYSWSAYSIPQLDLNIFLTNNIDRQNCFNTRTIGFTLHFVGYVQFTRPQTILVLERCPWNVTTQNLPSPSRYCLCTRMGRTGDRTFTCKQKTCAFLRKVQKTLVNTKYQWVSVLSTVGKAKFAQIPESERYNRVHLHHKATVMGWS